MKNSRIISIFIMISTLNLPFIALAEYVWTERQPAGNADKGWAGTASDVDGTNLVAAVAGGRLYTSSDGGVNWTERQPAGAIDKNWFSVASDSDGSNLIAGVYSGRIYTSSDGGVNWTERQPAGNTDGNWGEVVSDDDGSNLLAVAFAGRVYTSSDGGVNWTERQPAGNNNKLWITATSDSDGSNLVVAELGGSFFVSSDFGVNWTERDPTGTGSADWNALSSNTDGSILAAGTILPDGAIYTSMDSGVTWTEEQQAQKDHYTISLDSDGSNIITGGYGARLYTGFADVVPPAVIYLNPADGATDVAVDAIFEIAFDETIATSTGNIILKKGSDDSTIETISIGSALIAASSTTALIIDPSVTLANDTNYYFQIAATAIDDSSGNSYAGIIDTTTWNFTTVAASPAPEVNTPVGNGPVFSGPATALPGYIAPRPQIIYPDGRIVYLDVPSESITPLPSLPSYIYQFTRSLTRGMSGDDVEELQKYLNTHGFIVAVSGAGSPGNETKYFGERTQSALVAFQKSKKITPAVGYFGPKTRAALK